MLLLMLSKCACGLQLRYRQLDSQSYSVYFSAAEGACLFCVLLSAYVVNKGCSPPIVQRCMAQVEKNQSFTATKYLQCLTLGKMYYK